MTSESDSVEPTERRRQPGTGSLERSLQWTLGLLVLAVLLTLTAAGAWMLARAAEHFAAARLAHDAEALVAGLGTQTTQLDRPLPPIYQQPLSGHYFVVRFADGRVLRSRSLWDHPFEIEPLAVGATALERREGPLGQRLLLWRAGYARGAESFTIAVTEDLRPLMAELRRFLVAAVGLSLLGLGVLLLVQRRLLRRGFRRIDAVRADVQRLANGEVDRLGESVPAEVQPLVSELNALIDGWRDHLTRSRNALGNLAHALKSPLNLILLQRDGPDDPVAEQAERMRTLIERELRRARIAGEHSPGRRFHPGEDIADLVDGIRTLYAERDLAITTEIDAPARLAFDQEDMLELIGNLLDNAAKWAARRVHLRLRAGRDGLHLSVEDDGPGVPEQAAATLAQRGGRLDEAVPGHGLGLAIVGDIVQMHGGEIRLARSAKLGGLHASIDLPEPANRG